MIAAALDLTPLPPEQAIAYLRAKGLHFTWDWAEMYAADHARAFTVAKIARVDLLQDILAALDQAQSDGTTLEEFRANLEPILKDAGWWGVKDAVNLDTGEVRAAQLGSLRRLRTIFNVNIQTSLQVGHYRAMTDPAVVQARPWWRYVAVMDGRTRPAHSAWNNTVLPADDPWWQTHYPPNGWNCRCTVVSMSQRELDRDGVQAAKTPADKTYEWTNPATGEVRRIPVGIDPGWDYNPGAAAGSHLLQVARDTAAQSPDPLRWALLEDLP